MKPSELVPFESILIEDRLRVSVNSVPELAASILENGLFHPPVVEEQADGKYRLLAGGRRMAALTLLKSDKVHGADFQLIPVTIFNRLSDDQRIVVELEENIQRESMTWQETVIGIYKYHKAKKRTALMEGDNWTQSMTGKLLNMVQAQVSTAITVAELLLNKDEEITKAENLFDACKVLAGRDLDLIQAEQMRRIHLRRAEQDAKGGRPTNGSTEGLLAPRDRGEVSVGGQVNLSENLGGTGSQADSLQKPGRLRFTPSDVAAFYHHGSALELLPLLAKTTLINHIVCDPPYAINMDNLSQESVERIQDTHQVEDNLRLIPEFIRVAYDTIAEDGFLCMWYDLDHHEKIAGWAKAVGWRVQRWPLTWCKTTSCSNQQSQCNITKSTEVCYFMRRSEKSMLKTKQSKNYILAPAVSTATHPFPKPYEVWRYLIESVSTEGQNVVDPFAGEGSCLAAAFKLGRMPIGIELDKKHIASGVNYVAEQINQRNILDDVLTPPI